MIQMQTSSYLEHVQPALRLNAAVAVLETYVATLDSLIDAGDLSAEACRSAIESVANASVSVEQAIHACVDA